MIRRKGKRRKMLSAVVETVLLIKVTGDTRAEAETVLALAKTVFGMLIAMMSMVRDILVLANRQIVAVQQLRESLASGKKEADRELWRYLDDVLDTVMLRKNGLTPWVGTG